MNSGEVLTTKWGSWTVGFVADFDINEITDVLDRFSGQTTAPFDGRDTDRHWSILHKGGRSTVYGRDLPGKRLCIKVFDDSRLQSRIRTLLGLTKARRIFRNGRLARERGVSVPEVFAYAENKPFGASLAVMSLLENSIQMNLLIEKMLENGIELASDPFFANLVDKFSEFTRDMHHQGIAHQDFSPRNLLVVAGENDINLTLIDLEDVFFTNDRKVFLKSIDHFHEKMARYVDDDVLSFFSKRFKAIYD